jgi:hypothetical protein
MSHYLRNISLYGRGHRYTFTRKDKRNRMVLIRRCHGPMVLPDREWSEGGKLGVDVKAWTICYTLPLLPPDLTSPPPPESIKKRFAEMIGTIDSHLGIQESGHDLAIMSAPLDPPLTPEEMDRWHIALILQAKAALAAERFDLTRAYYDKADHLLLVGGLFSMKNGEDIVPLVFTFGLEGGEDEWTGSFDIDDGYTGTVTPAMEGAFEQWRIRGSNQTAFPFLPPIEMPLPPEDEDKEEKVDPPPAKKAKKD